MNNLIKGNIKMKTIVFLAILIFSANSYSDSIYKDWVVTTLGNYVVAKTTNNNNETIGVFCGENGAACFPYLILDSKCAESMFSQLLVNGDEGVFSVKTTCLLIESKYVSIFENEDNEKILNLFIGGQPFGFAIALQSGIFRSARFSGIGAKKAVEEAVKLRTQRVQNHNNSDIF